MGTQWVVDEFGSVWAKAAEDRNKTLTIIVSNKPIRNVYF
jgi:hypothetical protein